MNRSLKFKLIISFGSLSLFVVVMALLSLQSMRSIKSKYGHIVDITMPNLQTVAHLNTLVLEANRLTMRVNMGMVQNDAEIFERNAKDFPARAADLQKLNDDYRKLPFVPGEEGLFNNVWNAWLEYEKVGYKFIEVAKLGMTDPKARAEATEMINVTLRAKRQKIEDATEKLVAFQNNDARERSNSANSEYERSFAILSLISLIVLAIAGALSFVISNYMNKTLGGIADKIRNSADETSSASNQLTSASSQLSQGATESAASLEETVSSLEELSSMVKLNSDHAKEANTLSKKSLSSAENGDKEIQHLVEAMSNMAKSSKKIEEIINVIDDIAFQTNLLALNAAVEAARAGEQGRGFAVVADAVRNLAGRSAVAAKDINHLIKESVEMTENGVHIADTSGKTLKEIVESAKKVADLNAEIAAASQEQANGIEQISKAMNHLDQAIQSNASSSEEVASSASEMSSQADALIGMVEELRVFVAGGEGQKVMVTKSESASGRKVLSIAKSKPAQDHIGKAEGF